MINFGQLRVFQNTNVKECKQCKEDIAKYEYYARLNGRSKSGKWMTTSYHVDCVLELVKHRIEYTTNNPKVNGKHTKEHAIHKLPEDMQFRRHTIQKMLSANDIPRLLEAYQRQSTKRVLRAYELIATRWAELHAMQIPFRTTLIANEPNHWKPKDRALFDALMKWDSRWVDHLASATSPEKKIELMMTRGSRGDLPTFPEDDRMGVQEKGASDGQHQDSPDSRVPDVPDAAGLPDFRSWELGNITSSAG